jgi:hypothetical protein
VCRSGVSCERRASASGDPAVFEQCIEELEHHPPIRWRQLLNLAQQLQQPGGLRARLLIDRLHPEQLVVAHAEPRARSTNMAPEGCELSAIVVGDHPLADAHLLAELRLGSPRTLALYDTECYNYCMSRSREHTHLEFIYLPLFERTRKGLLSDDDMHHLEDDLLENPEAGDVEDYAGGIRKVRARIGERGKSGSARVAYLYVETRSKLYFILAFPKNVQGALTQDQKKIIRTLVAQLKKER